jgi:hypothetical protein
MKNNSIRSVLAILLVFAFVASLAGLYLENIPESNENAIMFMLGQLSAALFMALGHFYNSTRSSAIKDETIHNLSADNRGAGNAEPSQ